MVCVLRCVPGLVLDLWGVGLMSCVVSENVWRVGVLGVGNVEVWVTV